MKLAKILLFTFALNLPAQAYTAYNRCDYKNTISSITVCSERPLSDKEYAKFLSVYEKSLSLYPRFLKDQGYKWSDISVKLTVHLMPISSLNNQSSFSKAAGSTLLGRYQDQVGRLFTHYGSIADGNTDLVHELAHYFNDNMLDFINNEDNEELAAQFEQYYANNI